MKARFNYGKIVAEDLYDSLKFRVLKEDREFYKKYCKERGVSMTYVFEEFVHSLREQEAKKTR